MLIENWQCEMVESFGLDPDDVLEFTLHLSGDRDPLVIVKLMLPDELPQIVTSTRRFTLTEEVPR